MPAPKASKPPQRKGPAFKPPGPVKATAQSATATKRVSGATASRPAGGAKKAVPSRPAFQAATLISSSSESGREDEGVLSSDDGDEQMGHVSDDEVRRPEPRALPSLIPLPLLNRLLHEGFEDSDTRIQQGAMELTAKYMEVFVREAIARAKFERADANKGGGNGISDGFLQVEDLERLAPQLVLDF